MLIHPPNRRIRGGFSSAPQNEVNEKGVYAAYVDVFPHRSISPFGFRWRMPSALLELTGLSSFHKGSWQRRVQDTFCNSLGVKVGFSNVAGCPAVTPIIGIDGIQCADRFVNRGETKHPFA